MMKKMRETRKNSLGLQEQTFFLAWRHWFLPEISRLFLIIFYWIWHGCNPTHVKFFFCKFYHDGGGAKKETIGCTPSILMNKVPP
jgi:hypothetical protein